MFVFFGATCVEAADEVALCWFVASCPAVCVTGAGPRCCCEQRDEEREARASHVISPLRSSGCAGTSCPGRAETLSRS
jgi:hypothetical protein